MLKLEEVQNLSGTVFLMDRTAVTSGVNNIVCFMASGMEFDEFKLFIENHNGFFMSIGGYQVPFFRDLKNARKVKNILNKNIRSMKLSKKLLESLLD